MEKNRKDTLPILFDLHYKFSMNSFEEFYRDSVSYVDMEQQSYIELKEMAFEMIGGCIKFRKFGRYKKILTIKMDITTNEYSLFLKILKKNKFKFLHDFTITNIRNLTKAEKIKFKKNIDEYDDEYDDE